MTIDLDPRAFGLALLPWTSLFTVIAGVSAIAWMTRRASSFGLTPTATYAIGLRTVLWALLGARLFHVIDYAGFYAEVPLQAFYLWSGGQSLWGAIIVGAIGGLWHARRAGASLQPFADSLAVAGIAAIAVGRFGDLLAGERIGVETALPWAITYANERSASFGAGATHPVALYELLLAGVLLAFLIRGRARFVPGWAIDVAFFGYALGSFLIGFATVHRSLLGLGLSQWTSIAVIIAITVYARSRILGRPEHVEYHTGNGESP